VLLRVLRPLADAEAQIGRADILGQEAGAAVPTAAERGDESDRCRRVGAETSSETSGVRGRTQAQPWYRGRDCSQWRRGCQL